MAAFIVATVRITDQEQFAAYAKSVAGLSERYGGESLVRGAVSEVLEGGSPVGERVVVTRFPDAEAARAYIGSAEYQAARVNRAAAAQTEMRLVIA